MNLTQNRLHFHTPTSAPEPGAVAYTEKIVLTPNPSPFAEEDYLVFGPGGTLYPGVYYLSARQENGRKYKIAFDADCWRLYYSTVNGEDWYSAGATSEECTFTTPPWEVAWNNGYSVTREVAQGEDTSRKENIVVFGAGTASVNGVWGYHSGGGYGRTWRLGDVFELIYRLVWEIRVISTGDVYYTTYNPGFTDPPGVAWFTGLASFPPPTLEWEIPDTPDIWLTTTIWIEEEPWEIMLQGKWVFQGGARYRRTWKSSDGLYLLKHNATTQKWGVYEVANPEKMLVESGSVGATDPTEGWPSNVFILWDGTRGLIVSGAGVVEANGRYVMDSVQEWNIIFRKVDHYFYVIRGWPGMGWSIGIYQGGSMYYTSADWPEDGGWELDYGGMEPVPTVSLIS